MKRITKSLVITEIILFFISSAYTSEIKVDNGVIKLVFDSVDFTLKRLERGGLSYYFEPTYSPIWAITLLDTSIHPVDTTDLYLSTSTQFMANKSYEIIDSLGGKLLTLKWKNISITPGSVYVNVKIYLPLGSDKSYWHIKVHNTSTQYTVFSVDFPYISPKPNYSGGTFNRLVSSTKFEGGIYNDPFSSVWGAKERVKKRIGIIADKKASPVLPAMQYVHLYDNNLNNFNGIFFATLDTTGGYCKQYNIEGKDFYLIFFSRYFPENNWLPTRVDSLPYDFLLCPISGDWISGAKFYRSLVTSSSWMQPKTKTVSCNIAFWFRGVPLTGIMTYLMDYKRFFGDSIRILVCPGDGAWTHFLPSEVLPGTTQTFVNEAIDSGFRVSIGTRTNWWPGAPQDGQADTAAVRTINGEIYLDMGGIDSGFFMCSQANYWSELYPRRILELFTLGCTDGCLTNRPRSFLCYSEFHNHNLGGGKYAMDGYKEMFQEIRNNKPEDASMMMEGRLEAMIPYVDAVPGKYYTEARPNTPSNNAYPIPLSACVYHDYIVGVGSSEKWSHYTGVLHFAYVNAYSFVNGGVLSVEMDTLLLVEQFSPQQDSGWHYVRLLVKYAYVADSFLFFGTWERPPTLMDFPNVTIQFPSYYPPLHRTLDTTSVLAGAFKSKENKLGLVFTNFTDNIVSGSFSIDSLAGYDMQAGFYRVYELDTLGRTAQIDSFNNGSYISQLTLLPRSVKFLIISNQIGIEETKRLKRLCVLKTLYPNPFYRSILIKYEVLETSFITLKLYDITGRLVKTLIDNKSSTGCYTISCGNELPSGIYFLCMEAGECKIIQKLIKVK